MQVNKTRKFYKSNYIFLCLMIMVFCIAKVLRGADTASSAQGGIWNYISFIYYPFVVLALMQNTKAKIKPIFFYCFSYTMLAFLSIFLNIDELSISYIYKMLMIPFFALIFASFYIYSYELPTANKLFIITFYVCLAINLVTILKYQLGGAARPLASDIYFSLGLFPFALIIVKNSKLRSVLIAVMFFAVFMSGKRAGLLAIVFAIVAYIIINTHITNSQNFTKVIKAIFVLTIILFLFYVTSSAIDEAYDLGIYKRLNNLFEDGGSGRDILYKNSWNAFKDSTLTEKIIGHGLSSVEKDIGFSAHNDFLEVLYSYGIFATVVLIMFYVCLFKECINMIRRKSPYAGAFAASIIIAVFYSMFSFFVIHYSYVATLSAFWGYVLALEKQRLEELRHESYV